jgi:hypothetical protein
MLVAGELAVSFPHASCGKSRHDACCLATESGTSGTTTAPGIISMFSVALHNLKMAVTACHWVPQSSCQGLPSMLWLGQQWCLQLWLQRPHWRS